MLEGIDPPKTPNNHVKYGIARKSRQAGKSESCEELRNDSIGHTDLRGKNSLPSERNAKRASKSYITEPFCR